MRLPNADRAIVQPAKLRDYCLSPVHPSGKHKARLFAAALGVAQDAWPQLRWALLDAARRFDAVPTATDAYGRTFEMRCDLALGGRSARVLIVWQVEPPDDLPRLITCYPI